MKTGRNVLLLALLFIVVVPLAWAVYHERNVMKLAGVAESASNWGYKDLVSDQSMVRFMRDSGAGRPYILDQDGTQLMEYSDWGGSSWISITRPNVSSGTDMLYLHPHGYASDGRLISHTMLGDTWELTESMSIIGPRKVKIDYYFIARTADVDEVQLSLSHFHWYYQNVKPTPTGFTASVGDNIDRTDIAGGVKSPPKFNIQLTTVNPQALSTKDPVIIASSDSNGVSNLATHYLISKPQRDIQTLVASEVISWNKIQ